MNDDALRAFAAEVPGGRVELVLKSDRYAFTARVLLADLRTSAVWKRSVVRLPPGIPVPAASRALARREADHLEGLAGTAGIPALLGRPSDRSFLRAWIDGTTLRDREVVPDETFPALRAIVDCVHERGIAYADLAKEENVLVDPAGLAWLIDFQISVSRDAWSGALVPLLQDADRLHLARHVQRRRPDQLTDADRALLSRRRGVLSRLHRTLLKKPYNLLTRRIVTRWSGAGEGRRPGEPRGSQERSG